MNSQAEIWTNSAAKIQPSREMDAALDQCPQNGITENLHIDTNESNTH